MDAMVLRELQRHFPARAPEWVNAGTIAMWGIYAILRPEVFLEPGLAGFRTLTPNNPAGTWGLVTLMLGMIQAWALFVNGGYHRTPVIRLAMSLASATVWFAIVYGFLAGGRPTFALVMYSSAIAINLISAYRASCDAVIADHTWRAAGAIKRGKSDRYPASRGA